MQLRSHCCFLSVRQIAEMTRDHRSVDGGQLVQSEHGRSLQICGTELGSRRVQNQIGRHQCRRQHRRDVCDRHFRNWPDWSSEDKHRPQFHPRDITERETREADLTGTHLRVGRPPECKYLAARLPTRRSRPSKCPMARTRPTHPHPAGQQSTGRARAGGLGVLPRGSGGHRRFGLLWRWLAYDWSFSHQFATNGPTAPERIAWPPRIAKVMVQSYSRTIHSECIDLLVRAQEVFAIDGQQVIQNTATTTNGVQHPGRSRVQERTLLGP